MGGPEGRRMGMRRGGGRGFGGGQRGFAGGGGGGMMRMAENPRVRQALNLTDSQVAQLRTISVNAEKASVETRAKLQVNRIELRELMRADNPDQGAIMAKMDEANTLQGTMQKQRVQALLSARGVLNADQLKKIKTFMQNRGAGGEGRGNMMGPRGGQGRPMGRPGAAPGGSAQKPATPPAQ
jgi:Spy/CpxP family protein refolding chaperone